MEETAYHEAGHAVMAYYLGAAVESLTIEPDPGDGLARFGEARIEWRERRSMTAKEFNNKLVLIALAGPVAEMIYRSEPLHPGLVAEWADDWQNAWRASELIVPDQRSRVAFLEEAARKIYQWLHNDQRWAAVAALADELLAHETLEAEQIHEVLEIWMRDA